MMQCYSIMISGDSTWSWSLVTVYVAFLMGTMQVGEVRWGREWGENPLMIHLILNKEDTLSTTGKYFGME